MSFHKKKKNGFPDLIKFFLTQKHILVVLTVCIFSKMLIVSFENVFAHKTCLFILCIKTQNESKEKIFWTVFIAILYPTFI